MLEILSSILLLKIAMTFWLHDNCAFPDCINNGVLLLLIDDIDFLELGFCILV
jgi:hypothetical protein